MGSATVAQALTPNADRLTPRSTLNISTSPDIDFNGRFIEVRCNMVAGRLTTAKNGKARRVDCRPS